jgi:membrane-bound serine protease (ClpP class)
VRESVNIGADEAVRIHVADLEAKSLPALLQAVDGRTLKRPHGPDLRLRTSGAQVSDFSMSPWQQLLHALIDPNIAYLLMLLAVYGLIAEVTNPGAILPGVIGVISAILALVAFASLPVNLAGALLIVFAFLLFLADLKAPTHGVLTVGGLISLLLGSAFLVNPGPVGAGINPLLIAGATLATVIMFGIVLRKAIAARSQKVFTGAEGMIGSIGQAREKLDPTGTVFAAGALWRGVATRGPIEAGSRVRIVGRQGLTLEVTQLEPAAQPAVEKV